MIFSNSFTLTPEEILPPDVTSYKSRLCDLLNANIKTIESLLTDYYYSSGGRINDIKIDPDSVTGKSYGNFSVSYNIGLFNACADKDLSEDSSMKINYQIDPLNKKVILTGEYIPEREPDEF